MDMFRRLNRILNKKTKLGILVLLVAILIFGLIEVLALSLIQPFISILLDNSIVYTNPYLNRIYQMLGLEDVNVFLAIIAFAIAFVYIFRAVYKYLYTIINNRFIVRQQARMSVYMLNKLMDYSYLWHTHQNTARLKRSVDGDVSAIYAIVRNMLSILQDVFMSGFILIYLFIVSPLATLAVLALSLLCAVLYLKTFRKKLKHLGKLTRENDIAASDTLLQTFGGIKEIKAKNKEEYFIGIYTGFKDIFVKLSLRTAKISVLPNIMIESIFFVGGLTLVGIVILAGMDITALVPQLSMIVLAAFRLHPAITRITDNIGAFAKLSVSLNFAYDKLFEEPDVAAQVAADTITSEGSSKGEIIVSNLTFKYPRINEAVLENVSLCIPKNESIALVGPSGAGKTTLADLILGVLSPDSGFVIYEGKPIHANLKMWSKNVGYIPQSIYLMDNSILVNVAFGVKHKSIDEEKVWRALERAQIREFVETLPDGIHTMVGERGVRLSGGQRQRIGIARALYDDPPILILDEATSSLDYETESAIIDSIKEFHGNKTVIIIAHRLSTIEHCDTVYRVEGNNVIQER